MKYLVMLGLLVCVTILHWSNVQAKKELGAERYKFQSMQSGTLMFQPVENRDNYMNCLQDSKSLESDKECAKILK